MANSRISTLGTILKPTLVRGGLALLALLATYDTLSSQFELPTIRRWWGMSGSLLPWWGWLLILQLAAICVLFEFAYRRVGKAALAANERPSPGHALARGLYIGLVSIDGGKIESQHLIEIGIIGFNGSGRAAGVSKISGSITASWKSADGSTEEIELPTPRLLAERSNTESMPDQAEFLIVLEQVLRPDMPGKFIEALNHGQIMFDFDSLEITMKSCEPDEALALARLTLWNGAVLRKGVGFSTHKHHKLRAASIVTAQASLGEPNAR